MTRKDYELIAGVFNNVRPLSLDSDQGGADYAVGFAAGAEGVWLTAVEDMADALAAENPRFDRAIFLRACGYN